jgi:CheY-like chemotaxis protein
MPSRLRVLAIDDEPTILLVLSRLLRDCEVVASASGDEACRLLATDQSFDVILCDLMMPEGGGDMVHAFLTRHHPRLVERVVFMTGGAFGPRMQEFLERTGRMVLHKPFTKHQLSATIAAVTAAPE